MGSHDERVMNLLLSNHQYLSAYDIADKISNKGKRLQAVQVYRSLEKLIDLGVVHKISTKNSYMACFQEGECASGKFLICTQCESVKEIKNDLLETEIKASAEKNRFSIDKQTIEIVGLCSQCQKT
tara:strand:- start:119 stop:496 length:378 start_codon:yes stop_codon:yes gene_type:complete